MMLMHILNFCDEQSKQKNWEVAHTLHVRENKNKIKVGKGLQPLHIM